MDNLINPNHSTFFKGGMLVGNVVFINEVIYQSKISKKEYLIIKVNF